MDAAEGMNSQLVETVDLETALNFLFGQSLLSRLKGRVNIRRTNRPIISFAAYGMILCRIGKSASSMVLLEFRVLLLTPSEVFRRYVIRFRPIKVRSFAFAI